MLRISLVINCKNETWRITRNQIETLPFCNHEEADTHMVYHAILLTDPAVLIAKDTDVFLLLAYAMSQVDGSPRWFQMIDESQFVNIRKVYDHLGYDICSTLPKFQAITGCDQTAFKFNVGKPRTFAKISNNPSLLQMIQLLGKTENAGDEVINDALYFIQTVLYSGTSNESYVDTRVRLYKILKTKSSVTILADPDSMCQEIRRCHLQSFVWLNCIHGVIAELDPENYGWCVRGGDEQLQPVWFTGYQLSQSLRKVNRSKVRTGIFSRSVNNINELSDGAN